MRVKSRNFAGNRWSGSVLCGKSLVSTRFARELLIGKRSRQEIAGKKTLSLGEKSLNKLTGTHFCRKSLIRNFLAESLVS